MNKTRIVIMVTLCTALGAAFPAAGQLKINEVYYNVSPQGGNQFVELYNTAGTNVYLDGMILTDEAGSGIEGVYKFPGSPGQTNFPVTPGQFVFIAVDATNATVSADWECYAGSTDMDNPSVSNLTLVSGTNDFSLFSSGDNVILADGTDTTAPIDPSTIVDGMNYLGGDGEIAPLSDSVTTDTDPNAAASPGNSLTRCPDGNDTDISSANDFGARAISPGLPNGCIGPGIFVSDATVMEGGTGTTVDASFAITLSATNDTEVTVNYMTSNGTAIAGSDYTAVANTLMTFSPGVTSQTVTVTVIGDDADESDETFYVILMTPTNASLSDAQGLGTITDDDTPLAFLWIREGGGMITAMWASVSSFVYLPQYITNPTMPSWNDLSGAITASSTSASLSDTAGVQRVYRVLQLY
ncbi:MAG: Calx-beta domain-containing protein [bacterium]